ncbi:glycoside hydrolase family 130 protein [Asticcacaulis sp. BYS171W]|uniref:Glycoside hydrolase family 130 protein n=1 Tax=Asticcacaulis aquaticus TaxID=2984212 RepID=A0ABT5HT93_9CAUL|nr:glycoside hydrolase family 130 protein [Asticcacaulis aquaticus]MDC7683214.1 glycoside hydrolase family 130 protein [Asticcacaulis aquaticus]
MKNIRFDDTVLTANPERVVLRPFTISVEPSSTAQGSMSRAERVCRALLKLSRDECCAELDNVSRDFIGRHLQARAIFLDRFRQIKNVLGRVEDLDKIDEDHAALIGAYFCHEYSFEAAAIMNPSVVPHPDQSGAPEGTTRFIMSVRTVGEGHISTISFRIGLFHNTDGSIDLEPESDFIVAAKPAQSATDGPVTVMRYKACDISGMVIFPTTRAQSNGLEDLRLVHFTDDDGDTTYLGTYTAYSGREIGCELFETEDFDTIYLTPFRGLASTHKGLALFPRKINGRYAAIGRLDHESLYYMETDDKMVWSYGDRIIEPKFPWELVQMGNCGSPIELDEGWLVFTHGVGAMRRYCLGAVLLDKDDPRKVIGRSKTPMLAPEEDSREGYVPNVVYSCGAMKCGDWVFLPYGVADSSIRFASLRVDDILQHLTR